MRPSPDRRDVAPPVTGTIDGRHAGLAGEILQLTAGGTRLDVAPAFGGAVVA